MLVWIMPPFALQTPEWILVSLINQRMWCTTVKSHSGTAIQLLMKLKCFKFQSTWLHYLLYFCHWKFLVFKTMLNLSCLCSLCVTNSKLNAQHHYSAGSDPGLHKWITSYNNTWHCLISSSAIFTVGHDHKNNCCQCCCHQSLCVCFCGRVHLSYNNARW